MYHYWCAIGYIELMRGNFEASVVSLEKVPKNFQDFRIRYFLANTYFQSGRLGKAVAKFERILSIYDASRACTPISAVKVYYLLGLVYEKSGWTNEAIDQYETFLDIWKDADPAIKEIEDAKARLAELKRIPSK